VCEGDCGKKRIQRRKGPPFFLRFGHQLAPERGGFSIKIKEPVPGNTNGAETVIATSTSSPFDYTFTSHVPSTSPSR